MKKYRSFINHFIILIPIKEDNYFIMEKVITITMIIIMVKYIIMAKLIKYMIIMAIIQLHDKVIIKQAIVQVIVIGIFIAILFMV